MKPNDIVAGKAFAPSQNFFAAGDHYAKVKSKAMKIEELSDLRELPNMMCFAPYALAPVLVACVKVGKAK